VQVPAGFAVLVVLDGAGELRPQDGPALPLTRGDIAAVPWCSGTWTLHGRVRGLLCRPPAPDAPQAPR
jgi:mannose-6-phosphate isomerase